MGDLTGAQKELAALVQVPEELLMAAADHSDRRKVSTKVADRDIDALIQQLPPERSNDYLLRLARNEAGLSRLFLRELRELSRDKTSETSPSGKRVTYATLLAESKTIRTRMEHERREKEKADRLRHLKDIHDHRDTYWRQVEKSAERGVASGYDEATNLLLELRDAAAQFNETQEFQARFRAWIGSHMRRPALIKRLQTHKFTIPEM